MINFIFSSVVIVEVFICIVGLYCIFREKGLNAAESYCYSVILIFALYSLSIQIFFLLKIHQFYYIFDLCLVTFFSFQVWKNKQFLSLTCEEFVQFYKGNRSIVSLLILVLSYLFLQGILLPPSTWDSMTYNLARVLMFQGEGTLFLKNVTNFAQATYPWGYDILSFLFLRFYSDFGLSLFSFLSYTIVIVGTYGLVNKIFNNVYVSLTSAFIIASLKEIVLQATTTKNDIPMAAVTVICFLAGYNFFRSFKYIHLYIMSVAILFGLSVKGYFLGFMMPFLFFYLLLLVKEYSPKKLLHAVKSLTEHRKTPLVLPLGLFFCLTVFWVNNFSSYGNISGESAFVEMHINKDGILGGVVNVGRYMLQAADLPEEFGGDILTTIHNKVLGKYQSITTRYIIFRPFDLSGTLIPHRRFILVWSIRTTINHSLHLLYSD